MSQDKQSIEHQDRAHAIIAPSSTARTLLWDDKGCTASLVWSKGLPEEEPSKHAKLGTYAHETLEAAQREFLPRTYDDVEELLEFIAERVDPKIVEEFVDYDAQGAVDDLIVNVADAVLAQRKAEEAFHTPMSEMKRSIEETIVYHEKYNWGHCDYALIRQKPSGRYDVFIQDYKYGMKEVEAEGNTQLLNYLLALLATKEIDPEEIDCAYLTIFQQRTGGHPVKVWKLETTELVHLAVKFEAALRHSIAVYEGREEPVARSGSWCHFCPCMSTCPELRKDIKEKALVVLDEPQTEVPAVGILSLDQMVDVLDRKKIIEKFLSEVEGHLLKRLQTGLPVPGYKLVESQGRRSFSKDEAEQETIANELKKNGVKDPWRKQLITIGQAEKLVGHSLKDNGVKGAMKQGKAIVDALTTPGKKKEIIVPASDARMAIGEAKKAIDLLGEIEK
jgi:hypothetical protein